MGVFLLWLTILTSLSQAPHQGIRLPQTAIERAAGVFGSLVSYRQALYLSPALQRSPLGLRGTQGSREWSVAAEQVHAHTIAFSPSGDWLAASGTDAVVRLLDAASGVERLAHDQGNSLHAGAAISHDGRTIAASRGKKFIELWDPITSKSIQTLVVPSQKDQAFAPGGGIREIEIGKDPRVIAFSPDDRFLAVLVGHQVLLFDVKTGRPSVSVALEAGGDGEHGELPEGRAVCDLGTSVMATSWFSKNIVLWDLNTGKKLRELVGREYPSVAAVAIAPNGRDAASCTGYWGPKASSTKKGMDTGEYAVWLWNVKDGRILLKISGHSDNVRSVTYAADGRTLLSAGEDKTIRLWEVATGKLMRRWDVKEQVNQVAISPDGLRIAAAMVDRSVISFPNEPPPDDRGEPPADAQAFVSLWDALGNEDASRAYAVITILSTASTVAPAFFSKRLQRIPCVTQADLARLIADLDADDFDRREAAARRLAALGAQAGPALRKALDETTSAEARSRLTPLVKALDEWVVTDPETLRALRAIWVLERIGTPEARAVLDDLAKGAPEARQTQEAKAALDFLDKRAAAKP